MNAIPLILSLETATAGGSVSLVQGNKVLANRIGKAHVSHSNSLLRDIDEVLQESGASLKEVDLFAAAVGPGSFTGLRIGLATLKGLAATLSRACVGIPTLQAIASAAGQSAATVALLPAGRGEVFTQLFRVSEGGKITELDGPAHLSPQRMLERYESLGQIVWAGPGAHVFKDWLASEARSRGISLPDESGSRIDGADWRIAPLESNLARHVAALAFRLYLNGQTVTPELLSAIYVRPSDAELKVNGINK